MNLKVTLACFLGGGLQFENLRQLLIKQPKARDPMAVLRAAQAAINKTPTEELVLLVAALAVRVPATGHVLGKRMQKTQQQAFAAAFESIFGGAK